MDDNENINKEFGKMQAQRDDDWAKIRARKNVLSKVFINHEYATKQEEEIVLNSLTDCLSLVVGDLYLYENEYKKAVSPELEGIKQGGITKMVNLSSFLFKHMGIVDDSSQDIETRLNSLELVRLQSWHNIYEFMPELVKLLVGEKRPKNEKDASLLLQCVHLVLWELRVRDMEIELIDGVYDEGLKKSKDRWGPNTWFLGRV